MCKDGKASVYNAGDPGSIPGSGRSGRKEMAPHSSTLAWKIPWRSLVGYSPGGCKVRLSDLTLSLSFMCKTHVSGATSVNVGCCNPDVTRTSC